MKALLHWILTLSWVSLKDIVLDTGQGLFSTSGESLMACYCEGWAHKSGAQNSTLNFLRPQNHTTFLAGGFGGSARINQLPFLRSYCLGDVTWLLQSYASCQGLIIMPPLIFTPWQYSLLCQIPWLTSWKNVRHPGNPRGALATRHRSNKSVDLRGLTCH